MRLFYHVLNKINITFNISSTYFQLLRGPLRQTGKMGDNDDIQDRCQHDDDIQEVGQLEQTTNRKKAFRFSSKDEIDLLKEVACIEPYRAAHGHVKDAWTTVAVNCGKKYDSERARRKFEDLISKFKQEDFENLKKSGTEEDFDEKSQLLTDLVERLHEVEEGKKGKKVSNEQESKVIGESIRDAAMKGVAKRIDKEKEDASTKKFKKDDRLLTLMEERQKSEISVMEKTLAHEEKKLALEERRLALEEEKWRTEAAEKKLLLDLLTQRQMLQ